MPENGGGYFGRLSQAWQALMGKGQSYRGGTMTTLDVPMQATAAQGSNQDQTGPFSIRGASDSWFGPWNPLPPIAPPGTGGRQFDYQTGLNLNYIPRGDNRVPFYQLRALADNLPILRIVIEKRKDQIAGWNWDIQPILTTRGRRGSKDNTKQNPRITLVKSAFRRPDRRLHFHTWLRVLLEDMLVIDAACIFPRMTRGGKIFSMDIIAGETIKQLINADGRPPLPEEGPAYQQILHGVPAADFRFDELMYMPRNLRSNHLYGYSPVEGVLLTINTALRRDIFNLEYYNSGTLPEGFGTLPKEWTSDQVQAFQTYFDTLLSGNLDQRRRVRMMPADFKYTEARQPPLKDQYDEWLARLVCAAFSIPPTPFITDSARSTPQTIQITANQEGIGPLKGWIKGNMDHIVQVLMNEPDLEFVWSGTDDIDPLEEAQKLQIYVASGLITRDEGRDTLGFDALNTQMTSQPTTDHVVYPLVDDYATSVNDINGTTLGPPGTGQGTTAGSSSASTASKAPTGRSSAAGRARPKKPVDAKKPASPKTPKANGAKTPSKTGRRMGRKIAKVAGDSDNRSAGDASELSEEAASYWEKTATLVAEASIVRRFTIPYLSNRSTDGETVYIDESVPFRVANVPVDQTLPWHELAEWLAMNDGMDYETAHSKIATPIERRRVESLGGDWQEYCDEFDPLIREVDDEAITNVPQDLDLRPYEDDNDKDALREIARAE